MSAVLKVVSAQEFTGDDYKPSLEATAREATRRAENAEEFARLQQQDRDRWAAQIKAEALAIANRTAPANDELWLETPASSPFRIVEAGEFAGGAFVEPDWLVEDLIPARGIGLAWGLSGSHKTGGMFDLMAATHRGIGWRDKTVKRGRSVCVVAEGEYFFANRLRAYAKDRGIDVAELPAVVPSAINLRDNRQVEAFALELKKLGAAQVWFDTLQQCSTGADENSVKDTGEIIANLKALSRIVGCFVGAIHHAGKSVEKGARGSSAWRPAVDVELYFESSDGIHGTMRVEKLKDAAPGGVYPFERKIVELGTRANGKPITSVVVVQSTDAPKRAQAHLTKAQKRAKAVLRKLSPPGEPVAVDDVIAGILEAQGYKTGEAKGYHRRDARAALFELRDLSEIRIDGEFCSLGNVIQDNGGWTDAA